MKNNKYLNFKNLIKLIALFFLFYYSKIFQYIPIILLKLNIEKLSNQTAVLLNTFSNLCLLIILLLIYRKDLKEAAKKLKKNFFKTMDNSLKYYLLGISGMMVTNVIITLIFKGNGSDNEQIVQSMISISPYLMLLNAGILGPIIEELVFRKAFSDTFKTKWLFLLSSSLIFGAMHVLTSATSLSGYLYLIPYACLGLSFAYMDYQEKNILPSVFMHIIHNSILVLLSTMR